MKFRKLAALTLAALMSLSAMPFTVSAQDAVSGAIDAEAQSEDFISLPFVDYYSGVVNGADTAYLENVNKDGRDVVMCTPNPASAATTGTINIDGYKYKPANIDMDKCRWIAVEYYYQSPEPLEDLRMAVCLTGLGGILKDGMGAEAKSQDFIVPNTWAIALFDMSMLDESLNPEASHILQQLHVMPYSRNTRTRLKETDIMYVSRVMFFGKTKPDFNTHTAYMNGYTDGTFKPSGTMTRAEACTVVARLLEAEENIAGTSNFADVKGHWAEKYVGLCETKGLLGAYSGNFTPDTPITRAEFSELVYLTGLAQDKGITASFTDVAESHPKYASIMAAAKAGLINGYLEADGTYTFKPDNTITRAEVVTVINRARGLSRKPENLTNDLFVLFLDVDHTHWAFADIAEAAVPHVEYGSSWLYPTKDPVLAIEEKIGTASLYDTALGYAKVAELDALEAQRIAEIRATPNMDLSGIAGKKYYVSNNGNNDNDGLTPETAVKTAAKANSLARAGDAVLFERGGLWRESFVAKSGITYTAYGEGEKPKLYGSRENGADPEKWGLVHEDPETGARIWQYHYDGMLDVGCIVFNEGEGYAYKDLPNNKVGGNQWVRYKTTEAYDYKKELENFEFFHDASSIIGGSYIDAANAKGPIYLRCDNGNPGKIFDSIEFVARGALMSCVGTGDITIDNLCLKYSAFGISAGTIKNLSVTNCEFQWIGGNVQSYATRQGEATRYGNAVEIYGGCDGYTVDNCYFYQIYDAAVTHQVGNAATPLKMDNIRYTNNVMDMCQYSIEYFFGSNAVGARTGTDILFENNLCRRAGFGFGSTRRDLYTQRHIRAGGSWNEFYDFRIVNNVFDRAIFELVQTNCGDAAFAPKYDGNTFIQGANNQLFSHSVGMVAKTDASAAIRIKAMLGDNNAKVYFVDNIPMYKYEFSYDKTAPVTEDDKRTFETTLNSEENTKLYPVEGETTEVEAPLVLRSQKSKSLYTALKDSMVAVPKKDSNGIEYSRITFLTSSSSILMDCYGLPKYSVKSPAVYYKLLLRTNYQGTPALTVYGLRDENGESAGTGTMAYARGPIAANGEWEEVIIQVTGIPEAAATSNQVHIQPIGRSCNGTTILATNSRAYLDVAAWAAFSNLASAEAFDMKTAAGKTEGAPDNVEVELPAERPTETQTPTIGDDEIVDPLIVRTQRTKGLGQGRDSMVMTPKSDEDGIHYQHITFNDNDARILMDCYGLPKYAVNPKGVYYKMLVRTNISAVPTLTVYGLQDLAGNPAGNGTVAQGTAPLLGNGQWEEVIIKAEGIPAAAATSNQVHLQPIGNMKGNQALQTPDAYLDIAAWAAFPNLASAKAYNIKGAAGMTEEAQSNTQTDNENESKGVSAPLLVRTQKAKALGGMRPSANAEAMTQNGVVFSRITFNNTADRILMDCFGLPKFSVESPDLCFKFLIRTNCKDMPAPMLIVYGLHDENGEPAGNGTVANAEKSLEGDGIWQEIIIKVKGIPANAATSNQVHFQPFGNTKGEVFFENGVPLNADAYVDVAGWAVFSNVESAMAYDLTAACSVS